MVRPEVSEEIVEQAARANHGAMQELLQAHFPTVHRLAAGLSGNGATADEVVAIVLRRGVQVLSRWRSPTEAANWFLHHTVLVTRQNRKPLESPAADVLATGGTPEFIAFIRALRSLPFQQAEAFILNYGEKVDPRQLAVAMDCSTNAAANHLVAAAAALKPIAGANFNRFTAALAANYENPPQAKPMIVSRLVPRYGRRKASRIVRNIFILATIIELVYVYWKYHGFK